MGGQNGENTNSSVDRLGSCHCCGTRAAAIDYVMTRTNAPEYMAAQPPERLAMLQDAPMWFGVTWAMGVCVLGDRIAFAVGAGTVLRGLLLRCRFWG